MADTIKVAVNASKGIFVQPKGHPARVVGYAAAAGVVFVSVAAGYGAYEGIKYLTERRRDAKKLKA